MRFFDHGSAYDDDAANEGRPVHEIEAERLRYQMLTYGVSRPVEEQAKLAYVGFSPASNTRQMLLLLGKWDCGSVDFDVCGRCQRVHIWHLGVLAVMQGYGFETSMLRMIRARTPDYYRWTRSGLATCPQEFWDGLPPELSSRPAVPCEHFDWRPGRVRNAWACLRYRRLTGKWYWPDARAEHRAVSASPAARRAAPERLGAQLEQARQDLAEADRRIAEAARENQQTEAQRAHALRKNTLARIKWLGERLDEPDR
ncbi:hypothetical protein [Kribbella sp. CA-294648]|uniref:hypothetical protein n=1 Tax=Kribbella sp. CA-294648 TaxID=3239948 RepID=UPI003D8EE488